MFQDSRDNFGVKTQISIGGGGGRGGETKGVSVGGEKERKERKDMLRDG